MFRTGLFTGVGTTRAAAMAFALLTALSIGGAGGYLAGAAASAQGTPVVTAEDATVGIAPASRWSHEERVVYGEIPQQIGPASRWSHEELPGATVGIAPASRWSHEERVVSGEVPQQIGPASRWSHEELPDYGK